MRSNQPTSQTTKLSLSLACLLLATAPNADAASHGGDTDRFEPAGKATPSLTNSTHFATIPTLCFPDLNTNIFYRAWRNLQITNGPGIPVSAQHWAMVDALRSTVTSITPNVDIRLQTLPTAELVLRTLNILPFYTQALEKVIPRVVQFQTSTMGMRHEDNGRELWEVAGNDTKALLQDPNYRSFLQAIFKTDDLACKEASLTLLAALIGRLPATKQTTPVELSYCIGLVVDQREAPDGIGHAWIQMSENIYDASRSTGHRLFTVNDPYPGYLPIVTTILTVDPTTRLISPKSYINISLGAQF